MYKIAKVFQSMKKEAGKEKKGHRRVKDSKEKEEPDTELAAVVITHTVQQQIREFKVNYYCTYKALIYFGSYKSCSFFVH